VNEKLVKFYFVLITILEQVRQGWFAATYVLFITSGMPYWEALWANVVFHFTMGIFDPVTGFLGDKFGHLRIYAIGIFIHFVGDLVYFGAPSLFWFSVAEFVIAIGGALMSEAIETWLKNKLGVQDTHGLRARMDILRIAMVVPAILGAIIASVYGRNVPFLLSALTSIGGLLVILTLMRRAKEAGKMEEFKTVEVGTVLARLVQNLRELGYALSLSVKIKQVRQVLVFSFFSGMAYQSFNMLWTIQLLNMSGGDMWLGTVWIGISIAIGIGSDKVVKLVNPQMRHIFLLYTSIAVPMLIAALGQTIWVVLIGFWLHEVGRGAEKHILTTYADNHIPDVYRSTLNSA